MSLFLLLYKRSFAITEETDHLFTINNVVKLKFNHSFEYRHRKVTEVFQNQGLMSTLNSTVRGL